MGRVFGILLLLVSFFQTSDSERSTPKLTLLNADVRNYAPFIVKALYHDNVAGTSLSALSETEKPIGGDTWYWTDDNAKSLEALSLPPVFASVTAQIGQITRFIIANSPPPFVFRRRADEHLEIKSDNPTDFRIATGLMNFHGNLVQGNIRHGYRFHDDRTEDAVNYGCGVVRFAVNGKQYAADTTQNVTARIQREAHAAILTRTIDLKTESAVVGQATQTFRIEANKPYVSLTLSVRAVGKATLAAVEVSTMLDQLDALHVKYSKFFSFPNPSKDEASNIGAEPRVHVLTDGSPRWWSLIQDGDLGFSYAINTLVASPERFSSVVSIDEQGREFRKVESKYRLGTLGPGEDASITERKVLLAGGLYTSMSDYAGVFEHLDDFPGLDLSISYDIGAELNGVASVYLADKRRLEANPGTAPITFKPEVRQWIDAIVDAYIANFPIRVKREYPYVFTRGHSFVILALDAMYEATGDEHYRKILQHLADVLLELQVKQGPLANNFVCVHRSFFLDCHASAMIALARAAIATGERRYAESVQRALGGYRIDANANTGQDVFFRQKENSKSGDSYYWVFKAGLLLRSLEALEVLSERGLVRLSAAELSISQDLQRRAVAYVGRTAHARDELDELLTCHKAGETNSETQAWALLGLYPVEHEHAERHPH